MANKRRKKNEHQSVRNLTTHLEQLGIDSIPAYQQWCAENGFSRQINKSAADRRRERIAVSNRHKDFQFKSLERAKLSRRNIIDEILAGNRKADDFHEKQYQDLCRAVNRIKRVPETEHPNAMRALTELYLICEEKNAKFITHSQPAIRHPAFVSCTFVEALASVALFSNSWIRPMSGWKFRTHNPRKQFDSLVSHLFAAHSVPSFFYSVWFRNHLQVGMTEQAAFVHVAAGHSIRKADIPIPYNKRMSHHFLRAPSECCFPQALRWGQILGLGGDAELARSVLGTFLNNDFSNDEFWSSVIDWFIAHPMFDRDLFGAVVDYLNNQKFGEGNMARVFIDRNGVERRIIDPPQKPRLSMKGRTPDSLLRDVYRWHEHLRKTRRNKCHVRWPHSGFRELLLIAGQKEETAWSIRQILGTAELNAEGQKMNHCVASYANSCYRGRTSIWSMRFRKKNQLEKRALTVEVLVAERKIVQARGKNNRRATAEEVQILRRWANSAELILDCFLA